MQKKVKVNVAEGKLVRHPLTNLPVKDGDEVPLSTYFYRKIKDGDLIEVGAEQKVTTKKAVKKKAAKKSAPKKQDAPAEKAADSDDQAKDEDKS